MVYHSKREYLEAIRSRYQSALKKEKSAILSEFCKICDYHPKHAIRLLRRKKCKPNKKPGKKVVYDPVEILKPVKAIWLASDQMCSKKLKEAIPLWLPYYEAGFSTLSCDVRRKLLSISPASLDRLLKPVKVQYKGKGLCSTKSGTLLKNQIPIRTDNWDITCPGYLEADTVAHCGNTLAGNFANSITFTDIYSGWTVNRATYTKNAQGVLTQIQKVKDHLPFELLGFDCDNGTEFLNELLLEYFSIEKISFTRSRPYKKNDNAHVEQKNYTHVRQLLGYDRFDKPVLVDLMNDLYESWCQLKNYFCPSMKLIEKVRVNSKYKKKYDKPKTPCERLLESPLVPDNKKALLRKNLATLNPFSLKKEIEEKLKKLFYELKKT